MKPLVSINIACYNRKEMLKECINSFITQKFTDWELVLVDDSSEDDLSFVSSIDSRIKYFRKEHSGITTSLNMAFSKSIGKYNMPFGSDDLASDDTLLEKEVNILEHNSKYDLVYCDNWLLQSDGKRYRNKFPDPPINRQELYDKMMKKQFIPHGGTLWRSNKIPKYDESVSPADDWELYLNAVERGLKFYHIPERLWTYRVGHERLSFSDEQNNACEKLLARRGYRFDKIKRIGIKCN
jgi:glycosyltransferase involved in cell wall biosynthesis